MALQQSIQWCLSHQWVDKCTLRKMPEAGSGPVSPTTGTRIMKWNDFQNPKNALEVWSWTIVLPFGKFTQQHQTLSLIGQKLICGSRHGSCTQLAKFGRNSTGERVLGVGISYNLSVIFPSTQTTARGYSPLIAKMVYEERWVESVPITLCLFEFQDINYG